MKTIGVLGLGSIGKRHADNLLAMGHNVLTYDPQTDWLPRLVTKGFARRCVTVGEFRRAEMDGVVIAAPSSQHVPLLLGFPSMPVLVEKPIGVSGPDCEILGMENLSRVMVGSNVRFHDCVEQARAWLPTIGTPIWANFTCAQFNERPNYLRDGVTLNWGAHEVDLALHFLGPANVEGATINDADTVSDILLLHDSGCQTTVHLDYLTKPEMRGFAIVGTQNHIAVRLTDGIASLGHSSAFSFDTDWNKTYIREMEAFIGRIDGKEDKIGATGQDGLDCLKLLLDAKRMAGL